MLPASRDRKPGLRTLAAGEVPGCYARPRVVTIELFGVPRLRAGLAVLQVEASSLGEAFRALGHACPSLSPSVVDDGRLQPFYMVAVNGMQFTADPGLSLVDGDVLVVVSAEAGG